jgi:hypothetical protein
MRIDTSGRSQELPSDIIIHGTKPQAPEKSCGNCSKKFNCSMLDYSMQNMESYGISARFALQLASNADLPIPMPCQGTEWNPTKNMAFENDPLVQRLGLSDVSEPFDRKKEEGSK